MISMRNPEGLTDRELITQLDELSRVERGALPEFLACLSEVERRGLHLDLGHHTLFDYCVSRLRLSEGAAMQRIYAARAAAKHLDIYAYLRDGELNVGVVALLSPHLNSANASTLLGRARGKSKRDIEALVVELSRARAEANRPPVEEAPITQNELSLSFDTAGSEPDSQARAKIQKAIPPMPGVEIEGECEKSSPPLPAEDALMRPAELAPAQASEPAPARAVEPSSRPAADSVPTKPGPSPDHAQDQESAVAIFRRDSIRLEAPGLLRVTFQAGVAFGEKLERVRGLLGRRNGRVASVLDVVLDEYLIRHDPSRRQSRARSSQGKPTRRVFRWVRDIVWRRDGGRCAFVSSDGVRCGARSRLEYDHIHPWALGGASDDPDNIRLLCRAHNLRSARRIFGERVPQARLASG